MIKAQGVVCYIPRLRFICVKFSKCLCLCLAVCVSQVLCLCLRLHVVSMSLFNILCLYICSCPGLCLRFVFLVNACAHIFTPMPLHHRTRLRLRGVVTEYTSLAFPVSICVRQHGIFKLVAYSSV